MMITSRRSFLGGLLSALAAPAIVHATNIMPVRNVLILPAPTFESFDKLMPNEMQFQWVTIDGLGNYAHQEFTITPGGWSPVPAARFNSRFGIAGKNIVVGDCILVERPKADCVAARNDEINRAHQLTNLWARKAMANGIEGGVMLQIKCTVQ